MSPHKISLSTISLSNYKATILKQEKEIAILPDPSEIMVILFDLVSGSAISAAILGITCNKKTLTVRLARQQCNPTVYFLTSHLWLQ
jgi:hypothetical protein